MKAWAKGLGIARNWITTVLGLAAGTPLVIDGLQKGNIKTVLSGLLLAALGSFAKDANKTGTK